MSISTERKYCSITIPAKQQYHLNRNIIQGGMLYHHVCYLNINMIGPGLPSEREYHPCRKTISSEVVCPSSMKRYWRTGIVTSSLSNTPSFESILEPVSTILVLNILRAKKQENNKNNSFNWPDVQYKLQETDVSYYVIPFNQKYNGSSSHVPYTSNLLTFNDLNFSMYQCKKDVLSVNFNLGINKMKGLSPMNILFRINSIDILTFIKRVLPRIICEILWKF
jgi:hypothetical protein